jgi:tetratricopeptide (TPR) repeat protein
LHHLARYKEAIAHYDKAAELNPRYPEAWHNRGNALRSLGQYEAAIASYDQSLMLKPDFTEAQRNRILALEALDQQTQTPLGYDTVPDLNLNCLDAWFNQGHSLLYLGRYDEAIANFNKVLTHHPKVSDTWNDVAKRVYHLAALYAHATEVFKNSTLAWDWLKRPSRDLSGQTPLQVLQTEAGAEQVEVILVRLESLAPSHALGA